MPFTSLCFQNDILTENTQAAEIKVDPPVDGNAANEENTVSGNNAVLLMRLFMLSPVLSI